MHMCTFVFIITTYIAVYIDHVNCKDLHAKKLNMSYCSMCRSILMLQLLVKQYIRTLLPSP